MKGYFYTDEHARQNAQAVIGGGLARIPLTQGKWVIVDEEDYQLVSKWHWHAFKNKNTFYARTYACSNGKIVRILMHRLILAIKDGMVADHKDSDGLNNRRSNIRECTIAENGRNLNLRKDSKTGFKGVSKSGNLYRARIRANGKLIFLGRYATKEAAALAYNEAAKKYHGEFACLNPITVTPPKGKRAR